MRKQVERAIEAWRAAPRTISLELDEAMGALVKVLEEPQPDVVRELLRLAEEAQANDEATADDMAGRDYSTAAGVYRHAASLVEQVGAGGRRLGPADLREPGCYWQRDRPDAKPYIVELDADEIGLIRARHERGDLRPSFSPWFGPIPPPPVEDEKR